MIRKRRLSIFHYSICIYLLLATALIACGNKRKEYKSPPHYNLNKPFIIRLPAELKEISGIAFYQKDNSLFAESDEKGCLYKIFLNKPTDIRKWKFSHKQDYEDIVFHGSTFYILNANGDIVTLDFVNDSLVSQKYEFPGKGDEFESLYYDDQLKKMVLVCKDCKNDSKRTTSAFTFDLQQHSFANSFIIDDTKIEELIGPAASKFKPSGASINPVTGEVYILSSINKVLVVTDRAGGVKELYHLDPILFNQPEGITFSPNGGLFIATEASPSKPAAVLYFKFNNASK